MAKHIARGLIDLVSPPECPGCEARLPMGVPVSFCEVCDVTLLPLSDGPGAYEYGGAIADAIQRFKYERRADLAAPLGALLAESPQARRFMGKIDVVMPVPLHARRRRHRRFDQARLLAKRVARALDAPLDWRTLRRVRDTKSQAELSGAERRANMTGAFAARPLPTSTRVLLVDDVYTTGATVLAAQAALCEAGVTEVDFVTLAASLRPSC